MSKKFRVCFNSPQSGWMSLELKTGEEQFIEVVSYTPYDSIRDLINVLATLMITNRAEAVVKWGINPESLDFVFRTEGEEAELRVLRYVDHRRIQGEGDMEFSFSGAKFELCRAFWKALRDLQGSAAVDDFARNWRHEFPDSEMRELTKLVKAHGGIELVERN